MKVNFKSYLRTLLAAAAVMFMAPGCDDDGTEQTGPTPPDPGKEVPSYTFSINVSSVLDSRVSVLVTPSELGATFYCGVATKELFDVFASDAAFLANDVENLQKEALDREMNFQSYLETVVSVSSTSETVTVPVSGLTKQTEYYAYCYGITLNGEVTSPLAKVAFTSGTPAPVDLVLSSEAKDITTDAVKVAVSALRANGEENGQNGYICEVQLKKTVDDFFADDAALISALEDMYAKADPKDGLQGKVLHGSQEVAVSGLLSGAEYYMILFGYDSTGVTTEVKKSTFTTKEKSGGNQGGDDDKPRTGYAAWVGDWTITSTSSEINGQPVSFNVKIAEDVYNKSFKITGWGITGLREEASITIAANYSNGTLSIPNDQLITSVDKGDVYWKGRFLYNDGKYYLISGNFDALEATLGANNKSATMVGGEISLQGDNNTYTVSGVEVFLKYADGSGWGGYKPADGYTAGDYPVGPYTMTKTADGPVSGGGDDPNPGNDTVKGSDANFTVEISNITSTSCSVDVTPKTDATYYFDLVPGTWSTASDADIIAAIENAYAQYGLANIVSSGPDDYDWDDLDPGTTYMIVTFGYDATGATTSVLRVPFTTPAGSGSDTPQSVSNKDANFTISATNITSSKATVSVVPASNSMTYFFDCQPASILAGKSDAEIVAVFQEGYGDNFVKLISQGNDSYDYTNLSAGKEYSAVVFGYDVNSGKATTAVLSVSFTPGGNGGGGNSGNGPTLTLQARAGDQNGQNTDNMMSFVAEASEDAVSGYYVAAEKAEIDKFLDAGHSLSDIVQGAGKALPDQYFNYMLSGGLLLTYQNMSPNTEYMAIFQVSNASGASTTKSISAKTTGSTTTSAAKAFKGSKHWIVPSAAGFAEGMLSKIDAAKVSKSVKVKLTSLPAPARTVNPLMQLGREESILDRTAVASSNASLKIYKTVSDIRVRTARTK